MKSMWSCLQLFVPLAAVAIVFTAPERAVAVVPTSLDEYVQKKDGEYSWKVVKTVKGERSTTFFVHLKSQSWLTKADVDRTVWEHWLIVVRPHQVNSKKAFLMVGGGRNDRPMPKEADDLTVMIAEATGTVVAELRMVPNQPLVFHGDGKKRTEDDLIAYCWAEFLKNGDAGWLPRFPMVKSVVRAMDCIQELMQSEVGGGMDIESFVVAGGSKRGWTTWMTAAADRRVEAIIPIVIDVVNVEPSMRHHAAVYGFWTEAVGDYFHHGIMKNWDHQRLKEIYRLVDPYFYRDRLTMPKYIINATGDQFFCPDSSQFYFADLKGEKLLRYVPNADHSLRGSDAASSMLAYYQMILSGKPRPKLSWTFAKDGSIRVKAETQPKQVLLWQGTNPKSRDFRLLTIGKAFTSRQLKAQPDGSWTARVNPPKKGWTAYFVELTFDSGGDFPLKITTEVRVVPNTLPHAGADPKTVPYEKSAKTSENKEK